jgi:hypothetical protein
MAEESLTVGYWNFGGRATPLRMLLEYTGIPYNDKKFEVFHKKIYLK